jgi:hypothetical protein
VREEIVVLTAALARDRAVELADSGNFEDAKTVLRSSADALESIGRRDEASALASDLFRLDSYDPILWKKLRAGNRRESASISSVSSSRR